jgi:hypothetical protein
MAKIVVLAPFSAAVSSGPRKFLPGDVVDSDQYSAADYTAITTAAPTKYTAAFNVPSPALIAAQAQAIAIRNNGGDPENQTEGIMYRAMF